MENNYIKVKKSVENKSSTPTQFAKVCRTYSLCGISSSCSKDAGTIFNKKTNVIISLVTELHVKVLRHLRHFVEYPQIISIRYVFCNLTALTYFKNTNIKNDICSTAFMRYERCGNGMFFFVDFFCRVPIQKIFNQTYVVTTVVVKPRASSELQYFRVGIIWIPIVSGPGFKLTDPFGTLLLIQLKKLYFIYP